MISTKINFVNIVVVSTLLLSSFGNTMAENPVHELKSEWTTPLKVGDKVPNVTFQTRVRIDSDVENPFDWKGTDRSFFFCKKRKHS